jgi:glycosyltransferase involved in cell wall biosynthesis
LLLYFVGSLRTHKNSAQWENGGANASGKNGTTNASLLQSTSFSGRTLTRRREGLVTALNPIPDVAVVLPVFNGEHYLEQCIASVLRQNLNNFELLIADDASTDASQNIISRFTDPRLRVYTRDSNLGLFANVNNLIHCVHAPLIHFLCQDDLLEPDCLRQELHFFADHPTIGMSFCKTIMIDENGTETHRGALGDLAECLSPHLTMQYLFYHGCIPGNLSTVCVRKPCVDAVGHFDESFRVAGDYELWTRLCQRYDLGVIHRHLVRLRSHARQLSRAAVSGVAFIAEQQRIYSALMAALPSTLRPRARGYWRWRQNVLQTHYALTCLREGRLKDFRTVVSLIGSTTFALGCFSWLATLNNRLYRPTPRFVS